MNPLTAVALLVFLLCNGAAIYHARIARKNLDPNHRDAVFRYYKWGPLASREIFTEKGWAHRNLALRLQWAGVILGGILLIFS